MRLISATNLKFLSRVSKLAFKLLQPAQIEASKSENGQWGKHFQMLDAWRGLAAMAVVLSHLGMPINGHYAVMIFFVISGYCILASADSCLEKNLSFKTFMIRRIRRIYIPYLLAFGFFVVTRIAKLELTGIDQIGDQSWTWWLQNLTMTQWLSMIEHPQLGPAMNPTLFVSVAWSLNYEEQFYIVVALLMLPLFSTHRIWIIAGLIVCSLCWNLFFESYYGIFLEYWAQFGVGCVVFYRLCYMPSDSIRRGVDVSLVVFCFYCLYSGWITESRIDATVAKELALTSGFGILLIGSRRFDSYFARIPISKPLFALGAISYSLYLVHQFNLGLVQTVVSTFIPDHWEFLSMVANLLGHFTIASIFWYFCERPFLNKKV